MGMKMLSIFDDILAKLPGNGRKTLIGGLISAVLFFFPDFPLNEDLAGQLAQSFGVVYLALGLLHKWIKARIGLRVF